MGNPPGPSIVDIIDVDLPRPRDSVAILDDPTFRDAQERLMRLLQAHRAA
jgi:hypothetical protein